ncbi:MAG: fluoride efflux transporter CrcB [Gemmatimonas sp.]
MASLWIAVGGAVGSVLRFWLAEAAVAAFGAEFPWGTVIANVTGSFVIGFVAGLTGPDGREFGSALMRQFLMVGICGGYTTFSSFSLQTMTMLQAGHVGKAAANIVLSLVVCLLAVWAGHACATLLGHTRAA